MGRGNSAKPVITTRNYVFTSLWSFTETTLGDFFTRAFEQLNNLQRCSQHFHVIVE